MRILNSKKEVVTVFDLGILTAGEQKTYTYYLENDSEAELIDITMAVKNKEIEILSFPDRLLPNSLGTIEIKWSPSLELKQGLKVEAEINATALYKSK